jgi:MYXO-CTERM domain-containing protein
VTTSFLVSTTNDPPGVPVLMDPADGVAFGEGLELVVSNSVDPEGETVSHDFHILDLRDALVEGVEGVEQGDSATAWAPELLDEGHYQWTSRATDASGLSSDWAEPRTIVVGNPDHAVEPDLGGMVDDKQAEGCSCSSTSSQRSSLIWLTLAIFGLAQRRKTPRC